MDFIRILGNNPWPIWLAIAGTIAVIIILMSDKSKSLDKIKTKKVGDGQHGTARWATEKEMRQAYKYLPFEPEKWRKGDSLPEFREDEEPQKSKKIEGNIDEKLHLRAQNEVIDSEETILEMRKVKAEKDSAKKEQKELKTSKLKQEQYQRENTQANDEISEKSVIKQPENELATTSKIVEDLEEAQYENQSEKFKDKTDLQEKILKTED